MVFGVCLVTAHVGEVLRICGLSHIQEASEENPLLPTPNQCPGLQCFQMACPDQEKRHAAQPPKRKLHDLQQSVFAEQFAQAH